jgi:hypothetical protein
MKPMSEVATGAVRFEDAESVHIIKVPQLG